MTLAAGAVLVRGGRLAVVHRPRYDDWTLPKGKLDAGEGLRDAALRELREETGCEAELGAELEEVRYPAGGGEKRVTFYLARYRSGDFAPGEETDELRWLAPDAAVRLLSYDLEREVVRRASARLGG